MRWAMTLAWPEFQGQDDALVRVGSQLARMGKGTDAPAPRDRNGAGGPRGGSHSSGQGGRNEYGVPGIPTQNTRLCSGKGIVPDYTKPRESHSVSVTHRTLYFLIFSSSSSTPKPGPGRTPTKPFPRVTSS